MRVAITALLTMTLALSTTACGGSHDVAGHNSANPSMSSTSGATAADAMFAQMMIPHHEQAVEMANLTETRASAPLIQELAAEIKVGQQPEIDQMQAWLQEWGVPYSPSADSMDEHAGHGMVGMLTDQQLAELSAANGSEFDRLFAEYMILHHEGAIAMAEEVVDSNDARVANLAKDIIVVQTNEIAELQGFLDK